MYCVQACKSTCSLTCDFSLLISRIPLAQDFCGKGCSRTDAECLSARYAGCHCPSGRICASSVAVAFHRTARPLLRTLPPLSSGDGNPWGWQPGLLLNMAGTGAFGRRIRSGLSTLLCSCPPFRDPTRQQQGPNKSGAVSAFFKACMRGRGCTTNILCISTAYVCLMLPSMDIAMETQG